MVSNLLNNTFIMLKLNRLLPLIALATPASLTVESQPTPNIIRRSVPFPNFDNTNGISAQGVVGNEWSDYMGVGFIRSAGPAVKRILAATSTEASITPVAAPDANSSYSIQFYGPCLKCQYLNDAFSSHDYDNFAQIANNDTSLSELWRDFGAPDTGIYYKSTAPIGRNIILVTTGPRGGQNPSTFGVNITCQLRNVSYSVDFAFEQGIPSIKISALALEPVLNYSIFTAIDQLPPNGSRAYLSMFLALADLLNGEFGFRPGSNANGMDGGNLSVLATGLIACPEIVDANHARNPIATGPWDKTSPSWMCRNGSLAAAIEDLSHNFTLSMLSNALYSMPLPVNVATSSPMNYYTYHPKDLAISYLTGLGITLGCFLIGAWACSSNGYSASTSFSTIMHTTRNPQLDELTYTGGDGAEGWRNASRTVKLRYGILHQEGEMGHAAFGKTDTVARIENL